MTIKFEDSEGVEHEIPTIYEVCPRCEGKGSHTNPSIDGNGITAEEWWGPDWDDESREMYRTGGYDVICYECKGKRVIEVADYSRMSPELAREYRLHMVQLAKWEAEDRAIRRMESGGYDV